MCMLAFLPINTWLVWLYSTDEDFIIETCDPFPVVFYFTFSVNHEDGLSSFSYLICITSV